jgi:hypothetical protein
MEKTKNDCVMEKLVIRGSSYDDWDLFLVGFGAPTQAEGRGTVRARARIYMFLCPRAQRI